MRLERGGKLQADAQIQREIVTNLRADAGEEEKLNFKDMRRMSKGRVWDQDAVVELREYREAIDAAKLLKKNARLNKQNAGPSTPSKPPARAKCKVEQLAIVPDPVVNLWDNRSRGGEDTEREGSETGGSGSECEVVEEEEEFLMAKMLSLQLQNAAGDAGKGPSTPPQRTRYGRLVKKVYKQ